MATWFKRCILVVSREIAGKYTGTLKARYLPTPVKTYRFLRLELAHFRTPFSISCQFWPLNFCHWGAMFVVIIVRRRSSSVLKSALGVRCPWLRKTAFWCHSCWTSLLGCKDHSLLLSIEALGPVGAVQNNTQGISLSLGKRKKWRQGKYPSSINWIIKGLVYVCLPWWKLSYLL